MTVATVGEGEVFADAGFTDLFIAYPIWAAGVRGRRLCALAERVALRVGADSSEGVEVLTRALAGTEAEVVVEVESGHHRTGVGAAPGRWRWLRDVGGYVWPGCSPSRGTATTRASGSGQQLTRRAPCTRRTPRWVGPGWAGACAAADRLRLRRW